jgi:hypothetical protein
METKIPQTKQEEWAQEFQEPLHPERFCQLEWEEIMRYKNKEKKYDRGTIGAEGL